MSCAAPELTATSVETDVTLVTRPLGRMPLRLTELSLGCARLGNLYRAITDEQAGATTDAAWDQGIRYFDTAPHYGLGLSERRLGTALAERPRSEYLVSTKVGRRLEPLSPPGEFDDEGFDVAATHRRVWDFSRDGVLRSLEESLRRLGLDAVDIVYLHDPDDHRREALGTAYPALEELRAQGVVSAIGAGMNQSAMLADFARHTDMDVLMLAGRYTLLDSSALDDLLRVCERRGVGIVAAGVFNSGLLARPQPRRRCQVRRDYVGMPRRRSSLRARRMAEICVSVTEHRFPQSLLAFPLAHPAVLSVCVGARSPEQIERNVGLHRSGVPATVWGELKEQGLLRPDAPVPDA